MSNTCTLPGARAGVAAAAAGCSSGGASDCGGKSALEDRGELWAVLRAGVLGGARDGYDTKLCTCCCCCCASCCC